MRRMNKSRRRRNIHSISRCADRRCSKPRETGAQPPRLEPRGKAVSRGCVVMTLVPVASVVSTFIPENIH